MNNPPSSSAVDIWTPEVLSTNLQTPPITIENKEKLLEENLSREELEEYWLDYFDDPAFKFLPFPRWFRRKHKTLFGLNDEDREAIREAKEDLHIKLAYETKEKNRNKWLEEYRKKREAVINKRKKENKKIKQKQKRKYGNKKISVL